MLIDLDKLSQLTDAELSYAIGKLLGTYVARFGTEYTREMVKVVTNELEKVTLYGPNN